MVKTLNLILLHIKTVINRYLIPSFPGHIAFRTVTGVQWSYELLADKNYKN